jgi:hypothetical protein
LARGTNYDGVAAVGWIFHAQNLNVGKHEP